MWRLTWKGLLAHKVRFLLTGLAVVLGTAFIAGALTFGDTLEEGFEQMFTAVVGTADAVVRPADGTPDPAADPAEPTAGAEPVGLAPEIVDEITAVDQVALASGEMEGVAVLVGEDGEPVTQFGPPTLGYNVFEHDELDPAELREGRWPVDSGEVAVDAGTASAQGWELGDEVGVVLDGPVETPELVGIFGVGEMDSLAGASVVLLDADTAAERLGTGGDYTSVYVAATEGTSDDELVEALTAALDEDVEVLTSQELADEQQALLAPFVELFSTALLVFAIVALLVGSFLIFNTFTIVLAGRLRELALLRAVGAGRGQLMSSVLGEAAMVGLVGGALGALGGLAVALGLQQLVGVVGLELPGEGLVVNPRTIVVAVGVGAVVTVLAAMVPARRAVRVPPVAALTEVAVAAPAGRGIVRNVLGLLLVAGGAAGMAATLVGDVGPVALGAGAVGVFLGVALLAPLIIRPLAGALGWPAARLGVRGMLARANAMRNPRRTAATASALMIGLALVGFVSIFAASLQASIREAIDRSFVLDAFVQATTASGVPEGAVDELEEVGEVALAAPLRGVQSPVEVDGDEVFAAIMDPDDLLAVFDFEAVDGDLAAIADGGMVVTEAAADNHDIAAGDELAVSLPGGDTDVPVVAVIDGGGLDVNWFIDDATWDSGGGDAVVFNVYVQLADGVAADEGIAAVEAALTDYPQVQVTDQAGLADQVGDQLDQLLGAVVALLALSVIIALLGIVNTLALSVVERTREIGLLRAVGMTRPQVRSMVRSEAMIVALIGAGMGLALGVAFGGAFVTVEEFNIDTFVVPWAQLLGGVLAAALAGLLAGVLPARRAARLNVLDAVHAD